MFAVFSPKRVSLLSPGKKVIMPLPEQDFQLLFIPVYSSKPNGDDCPIYRFEDYEQISQSVKVLNGFAQARGFPGISRHKEYLPTCSISFLI